MDISETQVPLKGAAKIIEAGLSPKHGTSMGCPISSPQHITRDAICAKCMLHTL